VLVAAAGVEDDRGGVIQGAGELQELQVVGVGEPADVVQVVLAGDRDNGADQLAAPGELAAAGAGEHPAPLNVDARVDKGRGRCSVKYFR